MLLARKITRAKWRPSHSLSPGEISADAITGDLRTQGNTLSFWQCPSGNHAAIEQAALAIASTGDRIDKVDIVWLDDADLKNDGQTVETTEGQTPILDLNELHVDVCHLDFTRLGKVAQRIANAINEERYIRIPRARIQAMLADAIERGQVDRGSLQPKVRDEIRTLSG